MTMKQVTDMPAILTICCVVLVCLLLADAWMDVQGKYDQVEPE